MTYMTTSGSHPANATTRKGATMANLPSPIAQAVEAIQATDPSDMDAYFEARAIYKAHDGSEAVRQAWHAFTIAAGEAAEASRDGGMVEPLAISLTAAQRSTLAVMAPVMQAQSAANIAALLR